MLGAALKLLAASLRMFAAPTLSGKEMS